MIFSSLCLGVAALWLPLDRHLQVREDQSLNKHRKNLLFCPKYIWFCLLIYFCCPKDRGAPAGTWSSAQCNSCPASEDQEEEFNLAGLFEQLLKSQRKVFFQEQLQEQAEEHSVVSGSQWFLTISKMLTHTKDCGSIIKMFTIFVILTILTLQHW